MIHLTFDMEFYSPLRKDKILNDGLLRVMDSMADDLAKVGAKATFFCTGEFAVEYPEFVSRLARSGHEVANHTMNHAVYRSTAIQSYVKEIRDCDSVLSSIAGSKPVGFRAPNGSAPLALAEILQDLEYTYDSSMCRTYIPGWYEGGFCPVVPYFASDENLRRSDHGQSRFVEIPLGRFPLLPVPLGGFFLSVLPILSVATLNRMCSDQRHYVMYMHPFDLMDNIPKGVYLWDRMRIRNRLGSMVGVILSRNPSLDMRLKIIAESLVEFGEKAYRIRLPTV